MLGPFATASRRTPIHQVSLLSHAATFARRLRIDVHDDDNDNDNAWQRDRYGPHRMGLINIPRWSGARVANNRPIVKNFYTLEWKRRFWQSAIMFTPSSKRESTSYLRTIIDAG